MLTDKRGVIRNKWKKWRKRRNQVCPSVQMTPSSVLVIQWWLLKRRLRYGKMFFCLPFPFPTGKKEAENCKPKQPCESLPGSSLERVYVFHSCTYISSKQEISFYEIFQGCFHFSWDMKLSILTEYLSVCTF